MDKERLAQIEIGRKTNAKYIAMVVRNAMEDFHTKHLSDAQMKELNPIIRNAIYTALYALELHSVFWRAESFIRNHASMIPTCWEDPILTEVFEDQTDKVASVPQKHAGDWAHRRWQNKT
jgi:hypothetical protein